MTIVTPDLSVLFPKHQASLHLTHNDHKSVYQPLAQYLAEEEAHTTFDWATSTSKERAIQTDSLWELQWYPDTPISYIRIFGATLEEILRFVEQS